MFNLVAEDEQSVEGLIAYISLPKNWQQISNFLQKHFPEEENASTATLKHAFIQVLRQMDPKLIIKAIENGSILALLELILSTGVLARVINSTVNLGATQATIQAVKEGAEGGLKGGTGQILVEGTGKHILKESSEEVTVNGAKHLLKEGSEEVVTNGANQVLNAATTEASKQGVQQGNLKVAAKAASSAVKETWKTTLVMGVAVEGAVLAYQLVKAANDYTNGKIDGKRFKIIAVEKAATSVGSATGGIGGSITGAATGAAIGSVVPVIGNAVGALIGGMVGGIGLGVLGSLVGKEVGKKIAEDIK